MISRRLLRIKVLQILYSYIKSEEKSIEKSEKDLFISIQKTYDLYHYLIVLIVDIAQYANERIEIGKQKRRPTQDDLKPNTKFVDNKLIKLLENNISLNSYINNNSIAWTDNPELIKELYIEICESDLYKEYMSSENTSFKDDKKLIIKIFSNIILTNESFHQIIEEKSIFWNDDAEMVVSMIIKTIKKFNVSDGEYNRLLPLFKDQEDRNFVKVLYRKSIINFDDHEKLIEEYIKNWKIDRVAVIDNLILVIAITEMIEFPSIPVKVSMDEYIDISKYYSTEKSKIFINGILDKIVARLKDDKRIVKQGRGLIGEL